MDRYGIRLRFTAPPDETQLERLRATFPHLAELAPATLRERLSEQSVVVLRGLFSRDEGDAVVLQLANVGLDAEPFGNDYGLPYLRRELPAPDATWESAETALEVVFRPSFTPEVIVRLWTHDARDRLQLSSYNALVYHEHFGAPHWQNEDLYPRRERKIRKRRRGRSLWEDLPLDPPPARELPSEESANVPSLALFEAAERIPNVPRRLGIDGMLIDVELRRGERHETRELWSPRASDAPEAFDLLRRIHALAWLRLTKRESRRRLEELHSWLDLGAPVERLGGVPPVVRMWGVLTMREAEAIHAVLGELTPTGGVLDLSDVNSISGEALELFVDAASRLQIVARPSVRALLGRRAGIPSTQLHESRAEAIAAVTA
ncbi:MAG: hypothetical protein R3B99_29050 [Polyangiales bacterium]|nr:hypothetical protein [Myxococcales bacterium]MCB9604108.1 hypothetical protein [Sandaracinus sp.]